MDDKQKEAEEAFHTLMELYASFEEVMKTGSEVEKTASVKLMRHFQRMLKEKVTDYEEKHGIDFSAFDQLLAASEGNEDDIHKKMQNIVREASTDTEADMQKVEKDSPAAKKKKKSKNRMAKNIRSKGL